MGIEARLARKQRLTRLIFAHAGAELGALRDIGRVAKDEVEALRYAVGPISELELQPLLEAQAAGVGRGVGQSAARDVDAEPCRAWPHIERSEEQSTGPSAEIEDSAGSGHSLKMFDGGGNQDFRIRARNEHSRTDMQIDVPEGAAASDVCDRFALGSTADHLREALGNHAFGRR